MGDRNAARRRASGPNGPGPSGAKRPNPVTRATIFRHHDAHPVVLAYVLSDRFGVEWISWSPETLWEEIRKEFSALHDHAKSKIQAVRTALITDWVWNKWEIFCPIVQALNNNIPDFKVLRRPRPAQLFAAVDILQDLRDEPWGEEVGCFVASSLLDQSIALAPEPLDFAQEPISRYLADQKIQVDLPAMRERYRDVEGVPLEEVVLAETPVDVTVGRLLVARDYMIMRRSQRDVQMRSIL